MLTQAQKNDRVYKKALDRFLKEGTIERDDYDRVVATLDLANSKSKYQAKKKRVVIRRVLAKIGNNMRKYRYYSIPAFNKGMMYITSLPDYRFANVYDQNKNRIYSESKKGHTY